MDDIKWDIFMLEMEARNKAIIEEFIISKTRPRDLDQMFAQESEQAPQSVLDEEANGI